MQALPNWFPRKRVDYAQILDSCGGGKRTYDWENRAKWPSARWGAVWMERLGLSFELPQQRWLGADHHSTEYGTEMHTLMGRAETGQDFDEFLDVVREDNEIEENNEIEGDNELIEV